MDRKLISLCIGMISIGMAVMLIIDIITEPTPTWRPPQLDERFVTAINQQLCEDEDCGLDYEPFGKCDNCNGRGDQSCDWCKGAGWHIESYASAPEAADPLDYPAPPNESNTMIPIYQSDRFGKPIIQYFVPRITIRRIPIVPPAVEEDGPVPAPIPLPDDPARDHDGEITPTPAEPEAAA